MNNLYSIRNSGDMARASRRRRKELHQPLGYNGRLETKAAGTQRSTQCRDDGRQEWAAWTRWPPGDKDRRETIAAE